MGRSPVNPLNGKSAVVTGAARGIGRAIALSLLEAGADVTALQRGPLSDEMTKFAAQRGRTIRSVAIDLSDETSIAGASAEVLAHGPVDILVNNAGTQQRHDSVVFPLADFDDVLRVNLRAVFQLCQAFAPGMLERRSGKIINIASLLSFQGGMRVPAYAASKGAVAQLTKALCNEWAAYGVNVNAVAPGYITTDMNAALISDANRSQEISARIPAGRWGTAEDLGGAVVFLASAAADYIHGVILPVDGGWLAR